MSRSTTIFLLGYNTFVQLFESCDSFAVTSVRNNNNHRSSACCPLYVSSIGRENDILATLSSQGLDEIRSLNAKNNEDVIHVDDVSIEIPDAVNSIVLKQVYPAMISFHQQYGHPNIPLGTVEGKKCETLRRMQRKGKLPSPEVSLLKDLGFRFDSLEDIYDKAPFGDICRRLVAYRAAHGNMQVPKKFKLDPELGAWVAMVRRLGTEGIRSPDERRTLDEIGFEWKSTRKCGSAFMSNFREIMAKLDTCGGNQNKVQSLLCEDESILRWVKAQRGAYECGNLSEARADFMNQLLPFGINWTEI